MLAVHTALPWSVIHSASAVVDFGQKAQQLLAQPARAPVVREVDLDPPAGALGAFDGNCVMRGGHDAGQRQLVVIDENHDVAVHRLGQRTVPRRDDALRGLGHEAERYAGQRGQPFQHRQRVIAAVVVHRENFERYRAVLCAQCRNQPFEPVCAVVGAEGVGDHR